MNVSNNILYLSLDAFYPTLLVLGRPHQHNTTPYHQPTKRPQYKLLHHSYYKTIEKGCMSEMIGKLNLEPLNIRRTNRRLTIFHKAINGHLALPIGHLQPVLRRTRHLNSKAYNTIHTRKDCYKYSFFPRTIKYWNSLPDKLATINEPHKFKLALTRFD